MDELLKRNHALQIRAVSYDIYPHPNSGPGCAKNSPDFLRPYINQYQYALVVFDEEGCGESGTPIQIENALRSELSLSGWAERAEVIVIKPELESWVWGQSPHIENVLGWRGRTPSLREWLVLRGWCLSGEVKPSRPKEAMADAIRQVRKPWSSSLHAQLAARMSWKGCEDASFLRLQQVLQNWFSP